MGKTKLLILDFDGTLANTLPHVFKCVDKCIDKFGLKKYTAEDAVRYSGSYLENILKELGATEEQIPEIKEYYSNIFLEDVSDITLFDGVRDTLKDLKNSGYKLAIASNRGRSTIVPLISYLKLDDMFEKVVCETDVQNKKPYPDMTNQILNDMGFSKNEALIVGDTKADVMLGKNSEIRTCLVSYPNNTDTEAINLNPEYAINSFKDLKNII